MTHSGIREQATELFEEMGLKGSGLLEAWTAFDSDPNGTMRCASESLEGRAPAGLFLHKIRNSDHTKKRYTGRKRTGWRFVRGSHGGTYVRDVGGTDPLPSGHEQ